MFENIDVTDTLDDYILKGIKKGRRKKYNLAVKIASGTIVCILVAIFIMGIRVSPVFAANISKIPGMKYLVELVSMDKGLTTAIDKEYIQNINQSAEKNGITFTVRDIIADNSGIIIFYNLDNRTEYVHPYFKDLKLLDSSGKQLKMSSSYGLSGEYKNFDGKFEFYTNSENIQKNQLPDKVILQFKIAVENATKTVSEEPVKNQSTFQAPEDNSKVLDGVYEFPITIDKSKFSSMEKVYIIGQSVEIEGQKIQFGDIKIYPIKSIVSVSFDKSNTKKIFYFDDLKLIDETGQEWGRINNGMSGSYSGEDSQTLNFQSNYFHKPKELYITGSTVQALDKDKLFFTLDTDKKQITYSPYDLLSITKFTLEKEQLFFEAEIKREAGGRANNSQITNEAVDANGNKLDIAGEGMSSIEDRRFMNYSLKLNKNFKGPITFKINGYPTGIKGDFKVKIPLEKDK